MTTSPAKSGSQKVQEFLAEHGADFVVKELASSTRTAIDAANTLGCEVAQIAKSLIFRDRDSGNPVLVVASGANRVDTARIEQATGLRLVKADADFVKQRTGYTIGGVPPLAHNENVITILDPDLKQYDLIWAAAGTPYAVFALHATDLEALTGGQWMPVAE